MNNVSIVVCLFPVCIYWWDSADGSFSKKKYVDYDWYIRKMHITILYIPFNVIPKSWGCSPVVYLPNTHKILSSTPALKSNRKKKKGKGKTL